MNRCSSSAHIHAVTRPPPEVIRFSCVCGCDVTEVTSRKSCTIVTASTAAQAPKRLGFGMPAPRETMWSSAAQLSRRFPKNSFRPLLRPRSNLGGVCAYAGKYLFPKTASPVALRRFGPSQKSAPGALSIATSEIHARAARMCIGRDASDAHGGACSGASASRPASVKAPVGVDKLAHPEISGSPMRMRARRCL